MDCSRCGVAIPESDLYEHFGKVYCEDCFMYITNPPKTCDPTAVTSALLNRKQLGHSGAEGLTDLQKKIYQTIVERQKITRPELAFVVGIKPEELEAQCAILRHCELIRAQKQGDTVYLIKW